MDGLLVRLSHPDEPEVVARLDALPDARVVRRCADLAELLGAARAGLGVLAVLGLDRGVDRARIGELARAGVATVLVVGPEDLHRAGALGADDVVPDGEDVPSVVLDAVARLLGRRRAGAAAGTGADADPDRSRGARRRAEGGNGAPPSSASGSAITPTWHGPPLARVTAPAQPGEPNASGEVAEPGGIETQRGRGAAGPGAVVAVWGPPGSTGRSTIAALLAAELAQLGARSLLLDADTTAPCLTQMLGLLEESAGIAALCRAAGQGTLEESVIDRRSVAMPGGELFVSGLTRADRWRELPGEHVSVVLEALRGRADITVVDLAGGLEPAPPRGADRWAVSRTVLGAADMVLAVTSPDPLGVRRLVQSLSDLEESELHAPCRLVLAATRPLTRGASEQAAEALAQFAHAAPSWRVPYGAEMAGALLAGLAVAPAAPRTRGDPPRTRGDALAEAPSRRAHRARAARSQVRHAVGTMAADILAELAPAPRPPDSRRGGVDRGHAIRAGWARALLPRWNRR